VAVGDRIGPEALVDAAWQARKLKAQAVLKIGDFFGLRFEVALVKVGENKVENEKSSLNKFLGVAPPFAQVLSVNRAVQPPGI
jgi:hypothetical protein